MKISQFTVNAWVAVQDYISGYTGMGEADIPSDQSCFCPFFIRISAPIMFLYFLWTDHIIRTCKSKASKFSLFFIYVEAQGKNIAGIYNLFHINIS